LDVCEYLVKAVPRISANNNAVVIKRGSFTGAVVSIAFNDYSICFGRVRMTESNLFELAKNGNPQAIASLMNQVLEPKGVVAKAQLEDSCLHIVFVSEHPLSQAAISSFVQNGLNALGTKAFQTVKLYATKEGQKAPFWTDNFALKSHQSVASSTPTLSVNSPSTPPLQPVVTPPPTAPSVKTARSSKGKPHFPISSQRKPSPNVGGWKPHWLKLIDQYKVAIVVSLGAFAIGGTAALLFNPARSTSQVSATTSMVSSATNQALTQPTEMPKTSTSQPEAEVEAYLSKMNKAQQVFYQTNKRFATTLEELERSASVLSQSSTYTYRLVLREQNQAVLTATPKQPNFRSYSNTVFATNSSDTNTLTGMICKTGQPSNFPPVLPQATQQPMQCPMGAVQVTN